MGNDVIPALLFNVCVCPELREKLEGVRDEKRKCFLSRAYSEDYTHLQRHIKKYPYHCSYISYIWTAQKIECLG